MRKALGFKLLDMAKEKQIIINTAPDFSEWYRLSKKSETLINKIHGQQHQVKFPSLAEKNS